MHKPLNTTLLLLCHLFIQCQSPNHNIEHTFPYDFSRPTDVFQLDSDLQEISGLAWWNTDTLVTIEDEKASIYFLSTETGEVLFECDFSDDGDYEGIAVKNRTVFVLQSDGDVFKVENPLQEKADSDKNETALSAGDDTEGLHYDVAKDLLLIACKDEGDFHGYRTVFELTPGEKDIEKKPFLLIDEDELLTRLHKRYNNKYGTSFKPSGIARHPISNELYIVSAANSLIASFDENNNLKDILRLPFPYAEQIEGICFAPDGTLYISSEGNTGKIAVFNTVTNE